MTESRIKSSEGYDAPALMDRELRSGVPRGRVQLEYDPYDPSARRTTEHEPDDQRDAARIETLCYMTAGIAHDLNNVLSTIFSYGALAQRQLGPGRESRYIDHVLKASAHARALTQQLFPLGRARPVRHIPVCFQNIVEQAIEWLSVTLPENVRLKSALHAAEHHVRADATQLYQIVMNLCTNAVHAMERGGTLTVTLNRVTEPRSPAALQRSCLSGAYVRLEVSDTGRGISPGVLGHIFDPFFTTKPADKGSGLGLAIVRTIVRALDGEIDVRTETGLGTTFTVWLRTDGPTIECVTNSGPLLKNRKSPGHPTPRADR